MRYLFGILFPDEGEDIQCGGICVENFVRVCFRGHQRSCKRGLTGETVHNGSMRGTRYLFEQNVGLDKDRISKMKRMPTRWCCVFKNYPQAVMTQRRIMLASMMDEEDGKAVDSDGSTEGEEDEEEKAPKGRKRK